MPHMALSPSHTKRRSYLKHFSSPMNFNAKQIHFLGCSMKLRHFAFSTLLGFSLLSNACGRKGDEDKKEDKKAGQENPSSMNLQSIQAEDLYGEWGPLKAELRNDAGKVLGTEEFILKISKGLVTASATCIISGEKIGPVEVSSSANITDSEIETLQNKKASKPSQKGPSCDVSIEKSKMPYTLNENNTITFKPENQNPVTLNKIKR